MLVEVIEVRAHHGYHEPVGVLSSGRGTAEDRQLVVEELFELQSLAGFLHRACVAGEVYLADGLRAVHQMIALDDIRLQCLGQSAFDLGHQSGDDLPQRLAVEAAVLHPLGGVVVRFEAADHLRGDFRERRQLGMNEVEGMIELRRFAEQEVRHAYLQLEVLYAPEPHELYLRLSVAEHRGHTLRTADAHGMILDNLAFDLDECILVLYLVDEVEARAVDVLVRINLKELGGSLHAQLLTQNVSPSRADILAVCNLFV